MCIRDSIYTDRPIFRPGDTVYYKGIVRTPQFGRYVLPDVEELELSVNPNFFFGEDADTFSETFTVTLDEDGVFTGELVLPDDMPLGTYSFNITGDFWLSSRIFTVAEYRAPEFQVTVTSDQAEALRGEAANVTVEATYLFGGSAAGLPVNWNIYESEYIPEFDLSLIHISPFGRGLGRGPSGSLAPRERVRERAFWFPRPLGEG